MAVNKSSEDEVYELDFQAWRSRIIWNLAFLTPNIVGIIIIIFGLIFYLRDDGETLFFIIALALFVLSFLLRIPGKIKYSMEFNPKSKNLNIYRGRELATKIVDTTKITYFGYRRKFAKRKPYWLVQYRKSGESQPLFIENFHLYTKSDAAKALSLIRSLIGKK